MKAPVLSVHNYILLIAMSLLIVSVYGCRPVNRLRHYVARKQLSGILEKQEQTNDEFRYIVRAREGHLFYSENIRYCLLNWDTRTTLYQQRIVDLRKAMEQRGISFVVMVVPTKLDIYPELVIGHYQNRLCTPYFRYMERLDTEGYTSVPLYESFVNLKLTDNVFPRTDTHWGQGAIKSAASMLAQTIKKTCPGSMDSIRYSTEADTLYNFKGDMGVKLGAHCPVPDDTIFLEQVMTPEHVPFESAKEAPVFVCGDSFVKQFREYGAGIDAHLARELGCSVRSYYWISNETILRAIDTQRSPVKVFVWVVTAVFFITM